ncbi:hypothetical protein VTJ83DRAFT_1226 [Remersonia thermophila]|uniref:Uncharacterized protein n=1 Tax=Remersonia thermophila TaxID=72144 RepID=A0ABR4DNH9_9PEZI
MHGDGTPNNTDKSNADDSHRQHHHDTNPFVRFRHHVDANIHAGINTLTGPSRSRAGNGGGGDDNTNNGSHVTPADMTTGTTNTTMANNNNNNDSLTLARNLGLLSAQDHHFETRLASLTSSHPNGGCTLPQASAAWRLFLLRSAYSPLRLEHDSPCSSSSLSSSSFSSSSSSATSPWRHVPTPRDLPQGCQPGEVGWLEAFEDLLRASSGLPLTDLRERVAENRRLWGRFGLGLDGLGFPFLSPGSLFGGVDGPFGFLFGGDGWGAWDGGDRWDARDDGPWGWHLVHRHDRSALPRPGSLARAAAMGLGLGGEGVRAAAWLSRMEEQGLNEALFPVCDPARGYRSPRTAQEWTERRRAEASQNKETESLWEELLQDAKKSGAGDEPADEADREARREREREAAEEGRRRLRRELESWWDAGHDTATSFLDGVGGFVRMLGKVLEDEARSLQQLGKPDQDGGDAGNPKPKPGPADPATETDLYTLIQSAFHDSERSLSSLFKTLSEGWHNAFPPRDAGKPASPPKTETTESLDKATGLTKKTTKTEYVDERGNNHAKTETTWTDESGRVVMRQVHSSVGRAERWGPASSRGEAIKHQDHQVEGGEKQHQQQQQLEERNADTTADEERQQQQQQQQKKEGGWFWK